MAVSSFKRISASASAASSELSAGDVIVYITPDTANQACLFEFDEPLQSGRYIYDYLGGNTSTIELRDAEYVVFQTLNLSAISENNSFSVTSDVYAITITANGTSSPFVIKHYVAPSKIRGANVLSAGAAQTVKTTQEITISNAFRVIALGGGGSGGGAGGRGGGGGGGSGYLAFNPLIAPGTYNFEIGAGGSPGSGSATRLRRVANNSVVLTANGGSSGGGGGNGGAGGGGAGGSGGGSGAWWQNVINTNNAQGGASQGGSSGGSGSGVSIPSGYGLSAGGGGGVRGAGGTYGGGGGANQGTGGGAAGGSAGANSHGAGGGGAQGGPNASVSGGSGGNGVIVYMEY